MRRSGRVGVPALWGYLLLGQRPVVVRAASLRGGAAGETEVTSAFRAELEERDLLTVALAIVRPLHLRVDELQCKGAHASPALSAARKAFLGHLDGVGWAI